MGAQGELTREQAERLVGRFKEQAAATIVEDAYHTPLLIACVETGERVVMSLAGLPKEAMWPTTRLALAQIGATGYVLGIEAWSAVPRPEDIRRVAGGDMPGQAQFDLGPDAPRPSQHPDRVEVLMVSWQFRLAGGGRWSGVAQLPLVRHNPEADGVGGTVEVTGPWFDIEAGGGQGRGGMVRLLDPSDYGGPPPVLGL